jgi:hypothetical protein
VTTQTGGPTLCPSGRPPAAGAFGPNPAAASAGGCTDRLVPTASVLGRVRANRRKLVVRGRATDPGCRHGKGKVAAVDVAIARRVRHKCAFLRGNGRLGRPTSCRHRTFLAATGGSRWKLAVRGRLPRGLYSARARVTDVAGNVGAARSVRFRIR